MERGGIRATMAAVVETVAMVGAVGMAGMVSMVNVVEMVAMARVVEKAGMAAMAGVAEMVGMVDAVGMADMADTAERAVEVGLAIEERRAMPIISLVKTSSSIIWGVVGGQGAILITIEDRTAITVSGLLIFIGVSQKMYLDS